MNGRCHKKACIERVALMRMQKVICKSCHDVQCYCVLVRHCKHFVRSGRDLTFLLSNKMFLTKSLNMSVSYRKMCLKGFLVSYTLKSFDLVQKYCYFSIQLHTRVVPRFSSSKQIFLQIFVKNVSLLSKNFKSLPDRTKCLQCL